MASLCVLTTSLQAQVQDYKFKHLNMEDGLSSNTVYTILQDRKGFMWIGTDNGLNKYDGYGFTHYNFEPENPNSLGSNDVIFLHEDREGYLWVRSLPYHLDRLDPETGLFTRFRHDPDDSTSLGGVRPYTLFEDSKGVIWIGLSDGGLSRFNPETNTFTRYQHDPEDSTSLGTNKVIDILEDRQGLLWLGTLDGGINSFDRETETFTRYCRNPEDSTSLNSNAIGFIHLDRKDNVWVGFRGISRLDRETGGFTNYLVGPLNSPNYLNGVSMIYEDPSGLFWLGAGFFDFPDQGFNRFDPETESYINYKHDPDDPRSLSHNTVTTIVEDKSGRLWVGTSDGLNLVDRETMTFSRLMVDPDDPSSLSHRIVHVIYEDRSGVLWVGTEDGGISLLDPWSSKFASYPFEDDPLGSVNVWALHEDRRGTLWLGTSRGLYEYDRETKAATLYAPNPDVSNVRENNVRAILEDREGVLWFGTPGGLNRLDRKTGKFNPYPYTLGDSLGLSFRSILTLFEDSSSELWVGTYRGFNRYNRDTDTFTQYYFDPDKRSTFNNRILKFYEDQAGTLWVGTVSGLFAFDRDTGTGTPYVYDPEKPGGLSYRTVWTIYENPSEPGILWIGTKGGGLNRLEVATGQFTAVTAQNSDLSSNMIQSILADDQGNLWLGTGSGLSVYNPATGFVKNYTTDDGLLGIEFNRGAALRSADGTLLFGERTGVVGFRPEDIFGDPYGPPVALTGYTIFDRSGSADEMEREFIEEGTTLTLTYDQNDISFDYVGLHYSLPEKHQYAYMLEPYDAEWRRVGTQRTATYTNLAAGRYTFRVKAANSDGVWNEAGASVGLRVLPPWWQTWGFRFLAAALVVGLLTAAYRYRVAQLLKTERLRLRIASDLHDDVGSTLSAIAMRSELLRDRALHDRVEDLELHRISQAAEGTVDTLREIIWFIDPKHDRLDDLVDKMRGAAADLLNGTSYTFEAPDWQERRALGMDFRRQAFLIYKEALHNVVRHAGAKQVAIRVESRDGQFTLRVEDDGLGFAVAAAYQGHGLRNMRRRAEQLGGTLSVESVPGAGTTVELSARMA